MKKVKLKTAPDRPLGVLQDTFAKMVCYTGHRLPEDDAALRRRGRIYQIEEGGDFGRGDVTLTS